MWCPLPWTHLGVKNNGDLRMCSHSQSAGTGNTLLMKGDRVLTVADIGVEDTLNCDTLKQVRRDIMEGRWPEQCRRCQAESDVGSNSRNRWEADRLRSDMTEDMARLMTSNDGTVADDKFMDFDLRMGNQCNLRCVMCFPGETRKWYDIYEEITGQTTFMVDNRTYDIRSTDDHFGWSKHRGNIDALISISDGLTKINFGGGEPLIMKHHRYLLESLVNSGRSKHIELEYSSNITVFPQGLFDTWKHFKEIKICASIDAVGDANGAIRYPSDWETVTENLRMLDGTEDHISVFLSTTISNISLEHYGDLLSWARKQRYGKIKMHASHPVYNPRHFSIGLLDANHVVPMLERCYDGIGGQDALRRKVDHYRDLHQRISFVKSDDIAVQRANFVKAFRRLEKNQGQDWSTLFPVAARVVDEYQDAYKVDV